LDSAASHKRLDGSLGTGVLTKYRAIVAMTDVDSPNLPLFLKQKTVGIFPFSARSDLQDKRRVN
jgi:hypothetical protein